MRLRIVTGLELRAWSALGVQLAIAILPTFSSNPLAAVVTNGLPLLVGVGAYFALVGR